MSSSFFKTLLLRSMRLRELIEIERNHFEPSALRLLRLQFLRGRVRQRIDGLARAQTGKRPARLMPAMQHRL